MVSETWGWRSSLLGRTQVRKIYYSSSVRRKDRIIRRFVLCMKVMVVLAGMGGTSLLFILVHDALTQSPYFGARTIAVEGNHRLSREALIALAGLRPGDNILAANLRILRSRLMANPWIAGAEVRRSLPDTIHIRVRERETVARVEFGQPFYLDDAGHVVGPVDPSDLTTVPVVTGLKPSDIGLNSTRGSGVFQAVLEVLKLIRQRTGVLPLHDFNRIHTDSDTGLTLFCHNDGLAIKLGFGDYESKFDRLGAIISYLRRDNELSNIDYIYLNDVDRVVVRPSGGGSAVQVCYRKEV